ncbi:hypothetical protein XI06_15500 [Bradyrhizobium sp. CCBAU 11434]|nr:hypothetical protein [Bradyrhizobium sp. CCBAU 11434]
MLDRVLRRLILTGHRSCSFQGRYEISDCFGDAPPAGFPNDELLMAEDVQVGRPSATVVDSGLPVSDAAMLHRRCIGTAVRLAI